jgi:hypothetical protein
MLSRALDLALAALALLGPFAIHLFFPVIPVIKVDFQLTDALAQLAFPASSSRYFGRCWKTQRAYARRTSAQWRSMKMADSSMSRFMAGRQPMPRYGSANRSCVRIPKPPSAASPDQTGGPHR